MRDMTATQLLIYGGGGFIGGRYLAKNNLPLGRTHSDGSDAGTANFLIGYFGTAVAMYGIGRMVGLER